MSGLTNNSLTTTLAAVREDFPYLTRRVNDKPIVYLDNAATTQKPRQVVDTLNRLYTCGLSNVHRAVNFLADEVTQQFEAARETVARFLNATPNEIVFVSNATQGLNMVCSALCSGDRPKVLLSALEHHSSLLPWQEQAQVEFIPWDREGYILLEEFEKQVRSGVDLAVIGHASNFLGSVQPISEMIEICKGSGVRTVIDASQSVAHIALDMQALGCDALVFSGHKIYGPGGTGVLYINRELGEIISPVWFGGGMVKEVHIDGRVLNDLPYRFEAGTPNIEGAIALAAALDYITGLGFDAIGAHEAGLLAELKQRLADIPNVTTYGPGLGKPSVPLIPFSVNGLESTAVAKILGNRANIIVRSGFHCTQPAHDRLGIGPTVRASLGVYNSGEEIDVLVEVLTNLTQHL